MPDVALNLEETAATCYRAWHAAGGLACQPWEHLGLDVQACWMRLARVGEDVLTRLEGSSYQRVGEELARVQCDGQEVPLPCPINSPRAVIAYEALARHLAILLDADDVDNLHELEEMWGPWAQKKRESLITRTQE